MSGHAIFGFRHVSMDGDKNWSLSTWFTTLMWTGIVLVCTHGIKDVATAIYTCTGLKQSIRSTRLSAEILACPESRNSQPRSCWQKPKKKKQLSPAGAPQQMRRSDVVVVVVGAGQTDTTGLGGGSWLMAPAVPEERNTGRQLVTCSPRHDCDIEAHGIVFHCRGQPVQWRVQARASSSVRETSGGATGDETWGIKEHLRK